jgi:hypothetical protein
MGKLPTWAFDMGVGGGLAKPRAPLSGCTITAGRWKRPLRFTYTHGRDHNPLGFSMWLAGGGVKGGHIHGETDEYGYFAIRDRVTIHDLHATMLHLLGIDHLRLTYRFSGRDIRLTDVHGKVVHAILA